ncbi:Protein translocase subunit SA1, chloroplastic [Coccomyxa viridis]|uniref:Protein translocase subunit SecA n=1 Tax=Coccomyxa viridis TaxID=1274662 RepID=A0AAV1HYT1_9CHLO|nr:Protein translocase subunit SA1, chloroplastic [Coccomyxa viridis]
MRPMLSSMKPFGTSGVQARGRLPYLAFVEQSRTCPHTQTHSVPLSTAHTMPKHHAEAFRRDARLTRQRISTRVQAGFGGLGRFFGGNAGEKTRKLYQAKVDAINALEPSMQALSDEHLRGKTRELQQKIAGGASLDNTLAEAFAVAREASRRVLGLRPFDVQLIGAMILHNGEIAEMRTGEGKTLVAVLPAYLNALSGRGVQVVTVNDYLARRDSEWVGQVHRFLGLRVGLVQQGLDAEERKAAYQADITYVTNSELGFDYLRDNLAQRAEDLVLRDFNFCVIDEVDSILIDEARTPLIISGPAEKSSEKYRQAARLAEAMERDLHYTVDEKQKSILITEEGYEAAEDVLQVPDLYDPREQWASYLINALKAKELQDKNVNYIVRGQEIIIVDEFTGRTMPGRRWGDGLHQAVEAKEGVEIQNETVTLASISYQNFFRSYPKLAGMTGTAATEAAEFSNIYKLEVTEVPTNKPLSRTDNPDVVFRSEAGKWAAAVTEIKLYTKQGRPVLVGTTSVERSEALAAMLQQEGIKYELLNAKPENVQREAEIVAQSGRRGSVTISTNMAGRGTDILLGGNPEYMAKLKLRERLMPEMVNQAEFLEGHDSSNGSRPQVSGNGKKGKGGKGSKAGPPLKTWAANPKLFPRDVSAEAQKLMEEAVSACRQAWGERCLSELDAEDRLATACEKAPTSDPATAALRAAFQRLEADFKAVTDQEKEEVVSLGGLHVVGTERHEARRIDNQLRGRSGRQGDPGSTRFFLSLEDNLFRVFGGDRIRNLMKVFQIEDLPIESKMLTDALTEAQRKVEAYFFDIRKQLWEYDQVLNTQRDKVYLDRRRALASRDLSPLLVEYAERTVDDILEANVNPTLPPKEWPLQQLADKMKQYCYLLSDLEPELLAQEAKGDYEALRDYLRERGVEAYWQKVEEVEAVEKGLATDAQRFFVLTQTDNMWKEHLQAMKFLQQAVGLRGYAQREPLSEYKLEGYGLFLEMMAKIRRNSIYNMYVFQPDQVKKQQRQQEQQQEQQQEKQPAAPAAVEAVAASAD